MKRVLAILVVICLLLCGCGKDSPTTTTSYPLDESRAAMGDSINSYTAVINGKVFAFPISYSSFATGGFELGSNLKNATLKAGQYSIYKVSHGEAQTEIYIANLSDTEQKLTDSIVCGIVAKESGKAVIELPNKISFGAPLDTVVGKYGNPQSVEKSEEYTNILCYGTKTEGARLCFKEGKLFEIFYFRIADPETLQFSKEIPDEIKKYKDPEMLSSNLSDFTFYLHGATYTMPLPVSRLISAGWIKVAEQEYIPANTTVENAVKLTAANRTLTLGVKNIADYPTTVNNCLVTSIKSSVDLKLDLTLANGCRVGSTAYNLENTFGKENFTEIEKNKANTYYVYIHKGEAKLTVTVSNKTNTINEIKIELL